MDTHLSPALASVLEQQHPRWWWSQAGDDCARTHLPLLRKKRGEVQTPIPGRGAHPRFTRAGCPHIHSPERAYGKGPQGGCSNLIILLFNTACSTSPHPYGPTSATPVWRWSPTRSRNQPSQEPVLPSTRGCGADEAAPSLPTLLPPRCPVLFPMTTLPSRQPGAHLCVWRALRWHQQRPEGQTHRTASIPVHVAGMQHP